MHTYSFTGKVWLYPGAAAWHFISVPKEYRDEIKFITSGQKKGFGSVRVEVKIGGYVWKTSIFPDSKRGEYILPLKKDARTHLDVSAGDHLEVKIRILDI